MWPPPSTTLRNPAQWVFSRLTFVSAMWQMHWVLRSSNAGVTDSWVACEGCSNVPFPADDVAADTVWEALVIFVDEHA